jgi:hypothetical protein
MAAPTVACQPRPQNPMGYGRPVDGQRRVGRRALVGGAGAAGVVALTGCAVATPDASPAASTSTTGDASTSSSAMPPTSTDADVQLVQAAIAEERAILAYCGHAASEGGKAAILRLVASRQRRHVAALRAALSDAGPDHVGRVPSQHGDLRADLATAKSLLERAQQQRRSDALAAESGLLARLFASISASHAVAASLDGLSR